MMHEASPNPKFVVAQMGSRLHYAVPRTFHEAGMLERFYTDICASGLLATGLRHLPQGLRSTGMKRFLGRMPPGIPKEKIRDFKAQALLARMLGRKMRSPREVIAHNQAAASEFCRRAVDAGLGDAHGVYAFKSAALELFRHAKERDLLCVLDQTGALTESYWKISEEEHERFPGWQVEGPLGSAELKAHCEREREERELADVILYPSSYVLKTLSNDPAVAAKCRLVPYGLAADSGFHHPRPKGPLHVLMVGAVRLEKGIQYAYEAAGMVDKAACFRAVGGAHLLPKARRRVQERIELIGQVPYQELARHYQWADVLLFPTLSDSFGLVQLEAMARGLPVIATPHSGDVVRGGTDGYIVPIRDPQAIAERLDVLTSDRDRLEELSDNAFERAKEFSMEKYSERLLSSLEVRETAAGAP